MGYFLLPQSTECSRMCGIPVEFDGGVRNVTPKDLFSSSFESDITSAPVFLCLNKNPFALYSGTNSSLMSSKPCKLLGALIAAMDSTEASFAAMAAEVWLFLVVDCIGFLLGEDDDDDDMDALVLA